MTKAKSERVDQYILENHREESVITMAKALDIPYSTAQWRVRKLGLLKTVKREPPRKLKKKPRSRYFFDVDAVGIGGNWLF